MRQVSRWATLTVFVLLMCFTVPVSGQGFFGKKDKPIAKERNDGPKAAVESERTVEQGPVNDFHPPRPAPSDAQQAATKLGVALAFGTFWFWSLLVIELVLLLSLTENEKGAVAGISFVVYLAIIQWVSGVDIVGFVFSHPGQTAAILLSYVGLGICWAGFRFYWFYTKSIQHMFEGKKEWLENRARNRSYGRRSDELANSPEPENEWKLAWNKYVDEKSPQMIHCKASIIRWGSYWPVSMFWFFVSDFFYEIGVRIYNRLARVFQAMADSIRNRIKEKIVPVEKPAPMSTTTPTSEN